jgi:hypothetical protein
MLLFLPQIIKLGLTNMQVVVWALVGMSIAAMGFYASKGPFWSTPSMDLTGTAAASGIPGSIRSAISAASSGRPWWAGRRITPAALPADSMRSPALP